MSRYDPAGTSYNPDVVGPKSAITYTWRTETPSWFAEQRTPAGGLYPAHQLALIGDRLLVAGGGLAAFDVETGEQLFATPGPYSSAPARAPASVYRTETLVVTGAAGAVGLNGGGGVSVPLAGQVGSERWTVDTDGDRNYAAPVTADGTAYAPLPADDRLVAVDTTSGAVEWSQTITDPEPPSGRDREQVAPAYYRPAVRNGTVFAASRYGTVSAYDADTGRLEWQRQIRGPSLDADTGEFVGFADPVATEAGLFLTTDTEWLLLDPDDGAVRWRRSHGEGSGQPAVADGVAYHPGNETFQAIDLATNDRLWAEERWVPGQIVVADGTLYATGTQEVFAFDAETGDELFHYDVGVVESAPIVGEGRVYVATGSEIIAVVGEQ